MLAGKMIFNYIDIDFSKTSITLTIKHELSWFMFHIISLLKTPLSPETPSIIHFFFYSFIIILSVNNFTSPLKSYNKSYFPKAYGNYKKYLVDLSIF